METFKFIVTYTNDKRRVEVKAINREEATYMVHDRAKRALMRVVKIEDEPLNLTTMTIQEQIKAIVVDLAINDKLHGDLTQLDPAVFNQVADGLKVRLAAIQTKMSEQTMGAWNGKLEDTDPVIITGDYHGNEFDDEVTLAYNGWAEDLDNLIKLL
jgi:hypothetical protein